MMSMRFAAPLGGFGSAALGLWITWGFSVDDALISTRVAHHLAIGLGYRFNPEGPVVDCVTPLGWALLLAPLSRAGPWAGLLAARWLGAGCWLAAAAWLGNRSRFVPPHTSGSRTWGVVVPLLCLASCLPLGAWAGAGMETGLVMALCTLAAGGSLGGLAAGGLAAALRPELAPWAAALALGAAVARGAGRKQWLLAGLLALLPALIVAAVRAEVFGRAAPLAVLAKPSDASHGLRYAFGAVFLSGPAYLCAPPTRRALAALSPLSRARLAAFSVHVGVLLGVGGDWMPLWRLAVPVLPSLLLVASEQLQRASGLERGARLLGFGACAALLHAAQLSSVRAVMGKREALVAGARPLLAGRTRVAALDVGWVGAATPGPIADLAGLTDPRVARLPGGHTSKRLPEGWLLDRQVDAVVALLHPDAEGHPGEALPSGHFARVVEQRLRSQAGAEAFELASVLPLDEAHRYGVYLRAAPARLAEQAGAAR